MPQIDVVIPSYNEYENLQVILPKIIKVLETAKIDYNVLIIDRVTSEDGTRELKKISSKVKVINRYPSDCYGDAVRTGIKESTANHILFMDADGSHDPQFILQLYKEKDKAEVIIASRYVKGGGSFNGVVLKFLSLLVNISYRIILNIPAKDVSNSFKLYNGSILKSLTLKCNNFDIIEEILFKAIRKNKGMKIYEIPYFFKERMYGETKRDLVSFSFSFLFTLLKLRLS